MASEQDERKFLLENDFKNLVFANNPELYREIFKEDFAPKDEDIYWQVPESEDDVKAMLAELSESGFNVDHKDS